MCRWRPFWIFSNKKISPTPIPPFFLLVIDHTHTHPNQVKLASYDFFHRLCEIWASLGLLVLQKLVLQHVGFRFEKKTSRNISHVRLSIVLLSDSVPVTEYMNTQQIPDQCWFIVERALNSIKIPLFQCLFSWQKFATCPLGTP